MELLTDRPIGSDLVHRHVPRRHLIEYLPGHCIGSATLPRIRFCCNAPFTLREARTPQSVAIRVPRYALFVLKT
jgi:hypothetical protein